MSGVEITQTMAIVRAIFPLLVALTSLGILPLILVDLNHRELTLVFEITHLE